MKIDRTDTFDGIVYVMTETHTYGHVLKRVREIDPAVMPIKHVHPEMVSFATGYKIPSQAAGLEKILSFLAEVDASRNELAVQSRNPECAEPRSGATLRET